MRDIEKQAHAIIVRAKNQAARILAEAARIGEEMKREAHEQGSIEGRQSGTEQGLAEGRAAGHAAALAEHQQSLQQLIETLLNATSQLDAARRLLESEASKDVLELAIAIARRVTRQAGMIGDGVVNENVREAMKLAIRASDVRIAVHPSQKKSLEATLPAAAHRVAGPEARGHRGR